VNVFITLGPGLALLSDCDELYSVGISQNATQEIGIQQNDIWQSCILPNEKDIKDKYIQLKGIQMNNVFWVFLIMLSRRMTFSKMTLRRMAISRIMTFQHSSNEQD
jgi:hypothetical protein